MCGTTHFILVILRLSLSNLSCPENIILVILSDSPSLVSCSLSPFLS